MSQQDDDRICARSYVLLPDDDLLPVATLLRPRSSLLPRRPPDYRRVTGSLFDDEGTRAGRQVGVRHLHNDGRKGGPFSQTNFRFV